MDYQLIDEKEKIYTTKIIFTKKQIFIVSLLILLMTTLGSALGEWLFYITFINIP